MGSRAFPLFTLWFSGGWKNVGGRWAHCWFPLEGKGPGCFHSRVVPCSGSVALAVRSPAECPGCQGVLLYQRCMWTKWQKHC